MSKGFKVSQIRRKKVETRTGKEATLEKIRCPLSMLATILRSPRLPLYLLRLDTATLRILAAHRLHLSINKLGHMYKSICKRTSLQDCRCGLQDNWMI